ncbi:hypothetical protein BMF94_0157 [Rhodotorula taiwanensis]|uniref:EGF-like domain-containing protein n=1 Tax=Rhodotorula taiwanensis TaxID=741276 RepID=A0A2S5BIG3_9BASI|nr:hypothetical protein BMF94_0157 [Rhodotorula taiwanensis]
MLRESLFIASLLRLWSTALAATVTNSTGQATNTSDKAAVCTPDLCLVGANSLTAGLHVDLPYNGSTWQIALLPGSYTSSSPAFTGPTASDAPLSSLFTKPSTASSSNGFSTSGSLGGSASSAFNVAVQPGLVTYSSSLYQGTSVVVSPSSDASAANSSVTDLPTEIASLLLSSNTVAIASFANDRSSRLVLWESLHDAGELPSGAGSGGLDIEEVQASGCAKPCSSGGICTANGTCTCLPGFSGQTCDACSKGFFGRSCASCPAGCASCDDGINGTGICLDAPVSSIILPSSCNCVNGICSSNTTSATCECSAGWTAAANGTQCAACASGYYQTQSGECRACDPCCASCSGPNATCQTCQSGLQPDSSDGTKCVTATTASTNGTFITCPSRTFWNAASASCVDCNPLCESCFAAGTAGCLSCRSPNVLMPNGGGCVAYDSGTGVCNGAASVNSTVKVASGWVYDNDKKVCDALPPRCAAGGIDSFSPSSSRTSLQCSACLPGSYLVKGACLDSCPPGSMVSGDGKSCQACDSSCATCAHSPSYCTSCSSSSALVLNGTCTTSSSCPSGFFTSTTSLAAANNASSCLACHPDCATCSGPTSDACLSCPAYRPVLTAARTCVSTCASNEYYDKSKSKCVACDSGCATCSGGSASSCLSCPSGQKLRRGTCAAPTTAASKACSVIAGFGVCLEDLVTVAATSAATVEEDKRWRLRWWVILVIVLVVLALVGVGVWWFRKREQKRRRAHTARFAKELGDKEVDKKLAALPVSIAYPPIPRADTPASSSAASQHHLVPMSASEDPLPLAASHEVPLTPRFVLEDPASPISPSPSHFPPHLLAAPPGINSSSRWSLSSYGSNTTLKRDPPRTKGGSSETSPPGSPSAGARKFTTRAGNTLILQSRNPFR